MNTTVTKIELQNALLQRHGAEIQRALAGACVGVAGLGGLGSNIAVQLTRLGVGRLVLADFDTVDITNLNRQHYVIRHIGRLKTDAMLEQLAEINPWLTCDIHPVRVTAENAAEIFRNCSIVCEAFDQADQKAMLIEALLTKLPKTTVVSGNGMAGFGPGNNLVTRRAMDRLYICGDGASDSGNGLGLMAPRVALCAAHQANQTLRLLLGEKGV